MDSGVGRNLYFGSENASSLAGFGINATLCPGTAEAPNPTAGYLCVYVQSTNNIEAGSGELYAGSNGGSDAAENNGFYVLANSTAAGTMTLRYVWAYKAP
jgi:hypothetical protein